MQTGENEEMDESKN
jgi:hypothetical protein